LTTPGPALLQQLLGKPRNDGDFKSRANYAQSGKNKGKLIGYSGVITVLQNKALENIMQTFSVDSIRATGLCAAVNSLREVIEDVIKTYPDLKGRIRSGGMCVPRFIGTHSSKKNPIPKKPSRLSNHSWGCAIDLTIDGVSDTQGDNLVFRGLELMAPIFNKYGWFWGGAYITALEDAMHFEVSKEALLAWDKAGLLKKKGVFPVGVLAVQKQKSSPNPIGQKTLPTGHMIIKPLPRRRGEPWLGWFCRTVSTRVRHPSSWFH
jgi:hypothetical protein